jgi:hypothetical protein
MLCVGPWPFLESSDAADGIRISHGDLAVRDFKCCLLSCLVVEVFTNCSKWEIDKSRKIKNKPISDGSGNPRKWKTGGSGLDTDLEAIKQMETYLNTDVSTQELIFRLCYRF